MLAIASVALAAGWLTSAASPAHAEATQWAFLDVDLVDPVWESSGVARLLVTSGCQNPIEVSYVVGADSSADKTDTYDVSGRPATPGEDFRPSRGSFTLSRDTPRRLDIPVLQDSVVEGDEHVIVELSFPTHMMTFAGDMNHCETPGPDRETWTAAFVIHDDDLAPSAGPRTVPGTAATGAAGGTPSSPSGGAGRAATTTPDPAPVRSGDDAGSGAGDSHVLVAPGVELVGAEVPGSAAAGSGGAPAGLVGVAASGAALGVLATVRSWRRRRSW